MNPDKKRTRLIQAYHRELADNHNNGIINSTLYQNWKSPRYGELEKALGNRKYLYDKIDKIRKQITQEEVKIAKIVENSMIWSYDHILDSFNEREKMKAFPMKDQYLTQDTLMVASDRFKELEPSDVAKKVFEQQ